MQVIGYRSNSTVDLWSIGAEQLMPRWGQLMSGCDPDEFIEVVRRCIEVMEQKLSGQCAQIIKNESCKFAKTQKIELVMKDQQVRKTYYF